MTPISVDSSSPGLNPSQQQTLLAILEAIHAPTSLHALMSNITQLVRDATACSAVGIRLREGDDFPYFETHGFPDEFVELERSLCPAYTHPGAEPVLECMCGNVLQGRTDPHLPFFTPMGSFCSNATSILLATTSEAERQSNTRNRCNGWGYETVTLVPLRHGGNTFGLLQVNDQRENRVSPEILQFLEQLASAIALGLAHQRSVELLQRKNSENELMLQELQHRVRNSLQLVVSLLRIQEREIGESADAREVLGAALRRMESMAWVHDQLTAGGQYGTVELSGYTRQLVYRLQRAFGNSNTPVSIEIDTGECSVSSEQAIALGLIITELLSNSLRHAFKPAGPGTVRFELRRVGAELVATVADNGVGIPPERRSTGVGLRIIALLARKLSATLSWNCAPGTSCELRFVPTVVAALEGNQS